MITPENIFSNSFQSTIKDNVKQSYAELLQDIREDLNSGYTSESFSEGFLDRLKEIINDKALNEYTDLNFYWSNLMENSIYLIQLHDELSETNSGDQVEFNEIEDEIFNFWNDSDFAESFLELNSDGKSLVESSKILQPLIENQIISFFYLNISKNPLLGEESYIYKATPEKGDNEQCLYLGKSNSLVRLEPACSTFPTLPVVGVNKHENLIFLEDDIRYIITEGLPPIKRTDKELHVLPNCEKGFNTINEIKANINLALDVINDVAPNLYNTFANFTHTIIPIDEPGIVSYSQQQLPGYSCINIFERDFIDLLDDLLHENGHHYLNTFLNFEEVINEDDDKIYYSPWRKALRPIRGIYHATFTFYWALELFANLNKQETQLYNFSNEQKNKISRRFVEEYLMLEYCFTDLKHAYENDKVTDFGNDLINGVIKIIKSYKSDVQDTINNLDKENSLIVSELIATLKEKRQHYGPK
ncbi:HEXXH motif-containing putative peptide modification protein [Halobacteriovorax sp. HLS]|uniref:aKG-HExxH-type peptide beta-hydroxylase n=1 Tax=Halobacteriovorax sp. HLS TaxID=2234000 RepID=UPI000FDAAD02|nr:HEXXH motif-containing putative peptide modification protein [Halobacteriovorax sp. HLS]